MRKLLFPLGLLVLFVAAGCEGSAETRATNALGVLCSSYATVLQGLAEEKQHLTRSQIDIIDEVNSRVDPACLPGSVLNPDEAVGIVRTGINVIETMKQSVKEGAS